MNVRVPYSDQRERCHAYGLSLENQIPILDEMTEMVKDMRGIGRRTLLHFQRGSKLHYVELIYYTYIRNTFYFRNNSIKQRP